MLECKSYNIINNLDDDPTTLSIVTDIGLGEGSGTLNLNDHYSYRLYYTSYSYFKMSTRLRFLPHKYSAFKLMFN